MLDIHRWDRCLDDTDVKDFVALGSAFDEKLFHLVAEDKLKDFAVFEDAEDVSPHLLVLLEDCQRVEEEYEQAGQQVFGQVVVLGLFFLGKVGRDESETQNNQEDNGRCNTWGGKKSKVRLSNETIKSVFNLGRLTLMGCL